MDKKPAGKSLYQGVPGMEYKNRKKNPHDIFSMPKSLGGGSVQNNVASARSNRLDLNSRAVSGNRQMSVFSNQEVNAKTLNKKSSKSLVNVNVNNANSKVQNSKD